MPDVNPVLTPGETTTEYAAMQNGAWWGKAMIILGAVSTALAGVVTGIQEYQATVPLQPGQTAPGGSQLALVLMYVGIAMAIVGGVKKALVESQYIQGRSVVKAAALRDAPQPPPSV
jgi:hypothetical protein